MHKPFVSGQTGINEINGVNLDNYFPYQRTFDTVLYVHKRVLKQDEAEEEKAKKAKKKNKNKINNYTNERARNDSVLEQTVRFAKHLAPIVIPPDEDSNTPVFYTVQSCSKCRRKDKKPKEVQDDATYEKRKCKKIIETYRNVKKPYRKHSITESITHSSQSNTYDDININQSLNGTISEQSDKRDKYIKNEVNSKRQRNKNKLVISESFEAVATELTDADDTRIKVQLMNNAEKNAFCDSIRSPVLNAVRECMSEFNNIEVREEVRTVRRIVKCNTDKLDKIINKLAFIEKHLQNMEYKVSTPRQRVKASTLEKLGEDIDDEKSFGEEFEINNKPDDNRMENLGCGEVVVMRPSSSVGVKSEKTNRIPARYCWTDSNKD